MSRPDSAFYTTTSSAPTAPIPTSTALASPMLVTEQVLRPPWYSAAPGQDRKPYLAVGAAGNAWITSAVYQIVTSVTQHGVSLQQALELPRFLVNRRRSQTPGESGETIIQVEDGIARSVLTKLEKMGHRFEFVSFTGELRMGYASAVAVQANQATAAADPRRSGQAGALP